MLVDSIGQHTVHGSIHGPFRKSCPRRTFAWRHRRQQDGAAIVHAGSATEEVTISATQVEKPAVSSVESASQATEQTIRGGTETLTSQAQTAGDQLKDRISDAQAPNLGSASSEAAQQAANSAPQAAENATGTSPQANGVSGLFDGLQNAFSDVNKSVADTVTSLKDTVSSGVSGGQESFSGSSGELQKQVQGLTKDVTKQVEGTTGELGQEITKQLSGLSDTAGNVLQDASSSLDSLKGVASDAAADLGSQALQSANSALYTLPEPLRQTIQNILYPIGQALEVPTIRNSAIAVAIGYPAYLWFAARFGGFSGRLSPEEALKLLESEDSLLLDVRADLSRESSGIPELRFGARNKGVALPLVRVKQKTGTQVVKANVLSFQVAAILVRGLGKVSSRTKIIVLSDSETQGVKLARAIAAEISLQAYILKGGMSGWTAAGLPIKDDIEYESNAIAGLSDTVEGSVLPFFRNPLTLVGAIVVALGLSAVLIDEHKTLQFIGAFGLLFTFATVPIRYNSLQEARDDIFGPYLRIANFVLGLIPRSSSPSSSTDTSQLAGSSSNSAASLPPSSSNGQKASSSVPTDSDDEYAEFFKEDSGTQRIQQKPDDVPTSAQQTESESARPVSESTSAKTSNNGRPS